jgi:YaiO family outer membrane protein
MIFRSIRTIWLTAALTLACLGQTTPPIAGVPNPGPSDPGTVPTTAEQAPPRAEGKKNFHVEAGGFYSSLDNNYGTWKGSEIRIMYGGLKRITPFGSVSRQQTAQGSQRIYGGGSYIGINDWAYMIVGASGAPKSATNVALYPRFRWDAMGLIKVPGVKGAVFSTGISDFNGGNGGGARIYSLGGLYYYKNAIFSGAINFNSARPGGVPSKSGQAGFMYGRQGKYWVGAGASGGRVAYQLAGAVPFDVRFSSYGTYVFFQRWLGKNYGLISRYDHQNLIDAYHRNSISVSLFADF